MKRITGVKNLCSYQGRQILVAFKSPTRWSAHEVTGKKIDLGMNFDEIHAFVKVNMIKQRLFAA